MSMAVHAYTSFTFSYLNRARVLASSLRRQHPDWVIWAVLTDKPPKGFVFNLDAEAFDRMVTAEELFGDETERWLFGHDIVEACTAVKGRAHLHIMQQQGVERVVYFDPDIAVFNSMEPVIDILASHSIVLTPHQVDPEPADDTRAILDNEIASLDFGSFNLGFLATDSGAEANRFARWWDDRLHDWCHDRRDIGVFVDQKWCNLVPCFFDGVMVLRDPGYNVASWNLSQRKMHFNAEGRALINGQPLRFYHFTKLGPVGETMTRRYVGTNSEVFELWWWYRQQVIEFTDPKIPKGWWYYGTFDNGDPIDKRMRELYRSRKDLQVAFPDPRRTGKNTLHDWLEVNRGT
jgi:hypothetical protein